MLDQNAPLVDTLAPSEIDRILQQRAEALQAIREAAQAIGRYNAATNAMQIRHTGVDLGRIQWSKVKDLDDDALAVQFKMDHNIWYHLIEGGVGKLMSQRQRDKFHQGLSKGDFPAVTRANLYATFQDLHASAEDMLVQSVYDIWTDLARDYRSNDAPKFGPRIILENACHLNYDCTAVLLGYHGSERLFDLWRIAEVLGCIASPVLEPHEVRSQFRSAIPFNQQTRLPFGHLRGYKKGTLHLMLDEELITKLNTMLSSAAGKVLWSEEQTKRSR
jgi:hypothetical protein